MTQRRIDANRRNAARSTGPRTPEGKARVKLNALRHGLRARDETCLAAAGEEAQREIADTIAGLNEYFHPAGPEESAIIAEIALGKWKADRAFALDMGSRWWEKAPDDPDWPRMRNWVYALIRYDNRAHRMIYRGFDALRRAQRLRGVRFKNVRSKPLARRIQPAAPAQRSGPKPSPTHWLNPAAVLNHRENVRTNPLAGGSTRAPNTLRELTFRYWERESARANCTRWQN